ncbi:hypothetical protein VNO77_33453 [Canavalia gladiata]|uniref:Gnk2-homologous domain-containing protein n=1 Tax=Canavalia gladiata TaxID=3824 RepID=A0AAN9KER3_CANGL
MHSSMVVFSIINCKSNMPSNKILFLFTHISLLTFATTKAQDDPFFLHQDCSGDKTNANTSFQFYIKNLLSSLSSNAIGTTQFNMTKVSGENPSDLIYGMFMCRGDVSSHLCHQCVLNATQKLSLECSLSKQSTIWYEECMIRYSTTSLRYSISPSFDMKNSGNISNPESFIPMLNFTMNQTADEAVQSVIDNKKFATREANMSGFQTLYCLAQCTPDLSLQDCRTCLNDVIGNIPKCCGGRVGARVLYPSCNIRYELYPFYTIPSPTPTPKLVPETKTSHLDSKFSEDPIYLSHNCSNNKTFTANSTFQIYLTTLLSYLSSNASNSGKNFHKVDVANTVFGLFMCRGDLPSQLCGQCVQNGTHQISSKCYSFQEAIIWYSHCMIRYSYRNFFNKMEKSPLFSDLNTTNKGKEQNFFTVTVAKTLDKAVIEAGDSDERYGRKSSKFNDLQTLYTLAQCTQDLSTEECKGCLGNLIGASIPWSRLGSVGGRVLYPSCNVRFELFQFYEDSDKVGTPETGSSTLLVIIHFTITYTISPTYFYNICLHIGMLYY